MRTVLNWWRHASHKPTTIFMILMYVLSCLVFLPQYFSWSGVGLFLLFYWISGGLGITLCYHRLLTHRSFQTSVWTQCLLLLSASLAWQGSPLKWVSEHRTHHNHSDKKGDVHSPIHPIRDFWYAQIIWILEKDPDGYDCLSNTKDLQKSSVLMWFHRWWWMPQVILAAVLLVIGYQVGGSQLAVSWLFWGVIARTVVVLTTTNWVNSFCHLWGKQPFNTGDGSRNSWWVALVSFGEGNHNTHHFIPGSAAHGLRWYHFDTTYLTICILEKCKLVWNVKHPKPLLASKGVLHVLE